MSGCGCKKYNCCESKCCAPLAPEKIKCLKVTEKLISACSSDLFGLTRVDCIEFNCAVDCNCAQKSKSKKWALKSTCDEDDLLVFQRRSGCGKVKSVAALAPAGVLLQSSENKTVDAAETVVDPSACTRYTFVQFKGAFSATGSLADGAYDGQEKTISIFGSLGMLYTVTVSQNALPALSIKLNSQTPAVQLIWSEIADHWIPLTPGAV